MTLLVHENRRAEEQNHRRNHIEPKKYHTHASARDANNAENLVAGHSIVDDNKQSKRRSSKWAQDLCINLSLYYLHRYRHCRASPLSHDISVMSLRDAEQQS